MMPDVAQLKIKELWPSAPQTNPHDSIWSSPELPTRVRCGNKEYRAPRFFCQNKDTVFRGSSVEGIVNASLFNGRGEVGEREGRGKVISFPRAT
jgi:hypothetical protein